MLLSGPRELLPIHVHKANLVSELRLAFSLLMANSRLTHILSLSAKRESYLSWSLIINGRTQVPHLTGEA